MTAPRREARAPRPAAVAGRFYPDDHRALAAVVDDYVAQAREPTSAVPGDAPIRALIAPHAGYPFSGPIAGSGYAQLTDMAGAVERVLLFGPAHRWPVRGLAAPAADAFLTPLGSVAVDTAAIDELAAAGLACVLDEAHAEEHCIEVQLPFLQRVLGDDFTLVPVVAGDARAAQVEAVLDRLWDDPGTLVVVSSDLSHFLEYATAARVDTQTSRAIEALDPAALSDDGACGRIPIRGLLAAARRRGLRAVTVDQRSSGDTAGDRTRVVGYGAYVVV